MTEVSPSTPIRDEPSAFKMSESLLVKADSLALNCLLGYPSTWAALLIVYNVDDARRCTVVSRLIVLSDKIRLKYLDTP